MATFNFDSETNITQEKIPSAKAINRNFCGDKTAGLWIADENMESCNWRKNCTSKCKIDCPEHYVNTKLHTIDIPSGEEIKGRGIINPRILVLRRTKLLRISNENKNYEGFWVKGDGEIKDDKGQKKYLCARRYLIIFIDGKNKPLHEYPIQLTAKGIFQVEFDNSLMKFRNDIKIAYAKSMQRKSGNMNELWYAMCVFVPTFESKLVGKGTLTSYACSTNSYIVPTEHNWEDLCVGRNVEVNEIVNLAFTQSESWIGKLKRLEDNSSD